MTDTAPIQSSPAPPRTMVRHAAESGFDGGLRAFFEYRDLGIRDATRGAFGAHVIRAVPGRHPEPKWHAHDLAFQMVYVLKGWVCFEYEDIGEVELRPGDCVHQHPPPRGRSLGRFGADRDHGAGGVRHRFGGAAGGGCGDAGPR